jgi:hypothetical protein
MHYYATRDILYLPEDAKTTMSLDVFVGQIIRASLAQL